ncbi:MAG: CcmD family protein [Ignavibacteria bacterium]|jgi:CcmD family protein|nr:CcmD family protein [Ignavibacteria bacterium]MBK6875797.1 CcmD family protein [Ignavibacteria bacterium]MBK9226059.1 CcmD family protein [Ignavibacteria bacterium]
MYEFLETNSMYVVLLIVLIIWIGIFGYLKSMDKQIKNLETKE